MTDQAVKTRVRNARGHGGQLREDILTAAMQLLALGGEENAVTLRGIARATGIAAPSIYAHFSDVASIVGEVIARAYAQFELEVTNAIDQATSPEERLRAGVAAYLRWSRLNPELYRVLFARQHPSPAPAVGEAAAALFSIAEELLAAAADGSPGPDVTRARAVWMWVDLHGIASLRPSHPNFHWPSEDALVKQILSRIR